jgi:hypothetical protein
MTKPTRYFAIREIGQELLEPEEQPFISTNRKDVEALLEAGYEVVEIVGWLTVATQQDPKAAEAGDPSGKVAQASVVCGIPDSYESRLGLVADGVWCNKATGRQVLIFRECSAAQIRDALKGQDVAVIYASEDGRAFVELNTPMAVSA